MLPADPLLALVCDDELPIRILFSILLESMGFRVELAENGLDALSKMSAQPVRQFAVVVTDNQMPKLDGVGFVKALRASDFQGKIIVISGLLDQRSIAAFQELGVDQILSKMDGVTKLEAILRGYGK